MCDPLYSPFLAISTVQSFSFTLQICSGVKSSAASYELSAVVLLSFGFELVLAARSLYFFLHQIHYRVVSIAYVFTFNSTPGSQDEHDINIKVVR